MNYLQLFFSRIYSSVDTRVSNALSLFHMKSFTVNARQFILPLSLSPFSGHWYMHFVRLSFECCKKIDASVYVVEEGEEDSHTFSRMLIGTII